MFYPVRLQQEFFTSLRSHRMQPESASFYGKTIISGFCLYSLKDYWASNMFGFLGLIISKLKNDWMLKIWIVQPMKNIGWARSFDTLRLNRKQQDLRA